jgi:hypothetical protein
LISTTNDISENILELAMEEKKFKVLLRGKNSTNIRDHVDFGPLVAPLTIPLELSGIDGRLHVGFQRTHEWEAELLLTWMVGGVAAGVCSQFGARIADVIWDWANSRLSAIQVDDEIIKSSKQLQESLNFETLVQSDNVQRVITITPK